MNLLFNLFIIFAKIGVFSFGGGYAMLPFFQKYFVVTLHWINMDIFSNIVVISQITPGAIAISFSTFVGYYKAGILGAIISTIGIMLPSIIIVILISKFSSKFSEKKAFLRVLIGLQPAVIGLIAAATYHISISNITNLKGIIIFTASLFILLYKKIDPLLLIILAGILGILIK
ncbi:MAG TPA: chromate transporter [Clostridiaceae bacterium]